jgi:hypothetical protein
VYQPKEVITTMNEAVSITAGTRVSALIYDGGTVLVPGIVLDCAPGARNQRLRVLVRRSSGTFHTEEYLVAGTATSGRIRHDCVGVPGDELRQAWTDLAMWDLLDIEAGPRGPQGGDAVRLTTAWYEANVGDIGVLDGFVGQPPPGGAASITFNPATFRGAANGGHVLVRASGGPASISTPLRELTKTGQPQPLPVWRRGRPGRGRRQEYTVTVPLWDWTPGSPQ